MKALRTEALMCLEGAGLVMMGQSPHFFLSIPEERQKTRGKRETLEEAEEGASYGFFVACRLFGITQSCYFHCLF